VDNDDSPVPLETDIGVDLTVLRIGSISVAPPPGYSGGMLEFVWEFVWELDEWRTV
jgi:hypothetical protein